MSINDFLNFPILHTSRLVLKKLELKDLEALKIIIGETSSDNSKENVLKTLENVNQDFLEKRGINWGLFLQDELIGTCGYYRGFSNSTGEIGFVMRKEFRKKGLMTEALQTIIAFGL